MRRADAWPCFSPCAGATLSENRRSCDVVACPRMDPWLDDQPLPAGFAGPAELDAFLARPGRALASDLTAIDGDIIVLGVGGKMGPTLARLARAAAPNKRVIGVARFNEAGLRERLEAHGVETI